MHWVDYWKIWNCTSNFGKVQMHPEVWCLANLGTNLEVEWPLHNIYIIKCMPVCYDVLHFGDFLLPCSPEKIIFSIHMYIQKIWAWSIFYQTIPKKFLWLVITMITRKKQGNCISIGWISFSCNTLKFHNNSSSYIRGLIRTIISMIDQWNQIRVTKSVAEKWWKLIQ